VPPEYNLAASTSSALVFDTAVLAVQYALGGAGLAAGRHKLLPRRSAPGAW